MDKCARCTSLRLRIQLGSPGVVPLLFVRDKLDTYDFGGGSMSETQATQLTDADLSLLANEVDADDLAEWFHGVQSPHATSVSETHRD